MNYPHLHPWKVNIREAIQIQQNLRKRIILSNNLPELQRIVGVDVAFSDDWAICAVCIFEYPELNLIETVRVKRKVTFPYVPGLLTFREGPVILEAFRKIQNNPDLVLFDGQGICHHRRMGIATHLGIVLDVPSIGCAKSPLYGVYQMPGENKGDFSFIYDKNTVLSQKMNTSRQKNQKGCGERFSPRFWGDRERSDRQRGKAPMGSVAEGVATKEVLGVALRTRRQVKPLFVSCGYKISLMPAIRIILELCPKYRIPQPLRYAHQLAGSFAK